MLFSIMATSHENELLNKLSKRLSGSNPTLYTEPYSGIPGCSTFFRTDFRTKISPTDEFLLCPNGHTILRRLAIGQTADTVYCCSSGRGSSAANSTLMDALAARQTSASVNMARNYFNLN